MTNIGTNIGAFQERLNRLPVNVFHLNLDFTKPTLVDHNPVSNPTPNNSQLGVEGDRESWLSSITEAVVGIISLRITRRGWLHKANRYDLGLMVIALPLSIYTCWRLSGWINSVLGSAHPVVAIAAYFYVGFGVIWLYRLFFGYTKWAFPTAELEDARDSAGKHRRNWWIIISGVIAGVLAWFITEMIK